MPSLRDVLWLVVALTVLALVVSMPYLDRAVQGAIVGLLATVLGALLTVYLRQRGALRVQVLTATLEILSKTGTPADEHNRVAGLQFTLRAFNEREFSTALIDPFIRAEGLKFDIQTLGRHSETITELEMPSRQIVSHLCYVYLTGSETRKVQHAARLTFEAAEPSGRSIVVPFKIEHEVIP